MSLWRRVVVERRAAVLPLMVFLLANVAVLALGVFPLERSVAGLKQGEADALGARGQAVRLENAAKAAQTGKTRAEEELKKFYSHVLPVDVRAASQLTYAWLDQVAKESGVEFDRGTFKEDDIRDSRIKRWSGEAKLVGDYSNIRKFLYAVETAEEFVIIEEVGLSQVDSARGSGDMLVLDLSLSTYFLPRSEAGAFQK
jgi:Tfp pilus assembly protein PilO